MEGRKRIENEDLYIPLRMDKLDFDIPILPSLVAIWEKYIPFVYSRGIFKDIQLTSIWSNSL